MNPPVGPDFVPVEPHKINAIPVQATLLPSIMEKLNSSVC